MNDISTTIFYNTRIILSAPIETPVAWHCSKVEQTSPKGISRLTFVQEEWDEHKDVFEYADGSFTSTYYSDKKIVGMWADYNSSNVTPTTPSENTPQYTTTTKITYAGIKPEIKVGGNYKKFTVTYYKDKEETVYSPGVWKFEIDGKETNLVTLLTHDESSDVNENQIKVKFIGDGTYIGKVLTVKFVSDFAPVSSVDVEIKGL